MGDLLKVPRNCNKYKKKLLHFNVNSIIIFLGVIWSGLVSFTNFGQKLVNETFSIWIFTPTENICQIGMLNFYNFSV